MKLTRIYPDESGKCSFPPGSYGLERGVWYLRLPGCHLGSLATHQVVEHEDGSITVSPSILHHDWEKGPDGEAREKTVHGFLERGEWRDC